MCVLRAYLRQRAPLLAAGAWRMFGQGSDRALGERLRQRDADTVADLVQCHRCPLAYAIYSIASQHVVDRKTPTLGRHKLSHREKEVLASIAEGQTNQEMAVLLGISYQTVTTPVRNILAKLGLNNRLQATRLWWRNENRALAT